MSYTHNGNTYTVVEKNGRYTVYVESNGKKMEIASSVTYKRACKQMAHLAGIARCY